MTDLVGRRLARVAELRAVVAVFADWIAELVVAGRVPWIQTKLELEEFAFFLS